MSGFDLSGYTTVNERILRFYEKHPEGIISTAPAKIIELADRTFISVVAEVYTAPGTMPILAEAWETYPGKTPYTRDAEMMNAATSAIGRALMQLGIGIDKAAASADEVKFAQSRRVEAGVSEERTSETGDGPAPRTGAKKWRATEKQIGAVQRMAAHIPQKDRLRLLEAITTKSSWDELTGDDIDLLFSIKSAGLTERYNALKAIWADEPEDDPWAVEGM